MTKRFTSRNTVSIFRSINTLAVLSRYISQRGIDIELLIAGSGINPSDLNDPDFLAASGQELLLIHNLVKLLPEPGLGLIIGNKYHTGVLGKIGAAMISSNTLLDALKILLKFENLLMSYFSFNLEIKDSLAFGTMKELIDLKDIRLFVCERQFASTCRVASDLLGTPFKLAEIHVAYPEPAHATMYKDIFGCAVMFNADYHTLVFDKSYLYKPLPMANPLARKTYEKECRELSQRIKNQETISQRVSQEIFYRKDGIPDLDHLARHLNTSTRTLRRRLKEEGTSYKEIVASIQKNKAVELLQSTSMSVEQIAFEIGYSDLPNFYRAFKRWTGKKPGDYRIKS